jgi:hypothetical protein
VREKCPNQKGRKKSENEILWACGEKYLKICHELVMEDREGGRGERRAREERAREQERWKQRDTNKKIRERE